MEKSTENRLSVDKVIYREGHNYVKLQVVDKRN